MCTDSIVCDCTRLVWMVGLNIGIVEMFGIAVDAVGFLRLNTVCGGRYNWQGPLHQVQHLHCILWSQREWELVSVWYREHYYCITSYQKHLVESLKLHIYIMYLPCLHAPVISLVYCIYALYCIIHICTFGCLQATGPS